MYKIADGFNVAEENLTLVIPQPQGIGIAYTQRDYSMGYTVVDQGAYTIWRYNVLSASEYTDLLTTFGLADATTNAVTVLTRDNTRQFVRKNGTIIRPAIEESAHWQMPFYRDVEFVIVGLQDAT